MKVLKSRIFPWALLIGALILAFFLLRKNNTQAEYNKQLNGQLSTKEVELQKFRADLGLSQAQLLTQKELTERVQKDRDELDKNFQKFVKEHNLKISSRDKTIAELQQVIQGGTTTVVVANDNCVGPILYSWEDNLKRFKLQDPDIFTQNNETFTSSQLFKVLGEVYVQKKGFLKVHRLVLREVYKKEDGTFADIPDAKAKIILGEFLYSNEPETEELFGFKAIAVVGFTGLNNNLASGLGVEFLSYKQFGLSSFTFLNTKQFSNSEQHLGLNYRLKLFGQQTNLGIGTSIGTPFNKVFDKYSLAVNAIFYIN